MTRISRERLAWTGLLVLTTVVYAPVVSKLVSDWWTGGEYSHGLLCAPLAVAMAFARRNDLARIPPAPRATGVCGALGAVGLLLLGTLGAELFLTRISLLLFIASAVVFLYGWRHLRALGLPFALVGLSVPIPAVLMTHATLPLQFAASSAAETALNVMHIPVLRDGNVLVLSNATLQVAEACSGVRSLMSLTVLGLLIARYAETRAIARWAIVAAAVPVTLIINALRVTLTAIAAHHYGPSAAQGVVHEAAGMLLFLVAVALLLACARLVSSVRVRPSVELAR